MRYCQIVSPFFFVAIFACNANHKPTPSQKAFKATRIEKIINDIANNNTIESEYIGIAGSPSSQLARYKALNKMASDYGN